MEVDLGTNERVPAAQKAGQPFKIPNKFGYFMTVPIQQCHHCKTDLLDETPFCKIASSSLGI